MIRSPGDNPSTGVMTNPRHLGWRRQVIDAHLVNVVLFGVDLNGTVVYIFFVLGEWDVDDV
jgi:hypothetical protein